jgi:hypothetical protein
MHRIDDRLKQGCVLGQRTDTCTNHDAVKGVLREHGQDDSFGGCTEINQALVNLIAQRCEPLLRIIPGNSHLLSISTARRAKIYKGRVDTDEKHTLGSHSVTPSISIRTGESDCILAIFGTLVEGSGDSAYTALAGAGYADPGSFRTVLQAMPRSKSDVDNGVPGIEDADEER